MKKWFRSRTIRVPLIYGLFSILWIFTTDKINLAISTDLAGATTIAILKGTLFVVISTLLIYFLLRYDERKQASLNSELKTMQASFNSLFARNPLPIWMNDPDSGDFLVANQAACELYECSQEEFLRMKLADVCDAAEFDRLKGEIQNEDFFMKRSGPWQQVTCKGMKVFVDFFPTQIRYAGRNVTMMTVFDLSRQLEAEAELKSTATQRDDYEAFSYSVSHDLRAPLRAIKGYGQILLQEKASHLDREGKDFLEGMVQASQEMNQMIDNLLMLTRLKHSSLELGFVDLAALADGIMQQLAVQDGDRKVEFKVTGKAVVKADASLMKSLLANLIENAWKYTSGRNPAQIEFGSRVDAEKGRVFFIKDNGIGFDAGEVAEVFKPFHRTHAAGDYPGMGIGLSIAARIVERHNGQIWAEGERDKGATFYFTLGMEE
jgi:PAS domain S-box-containing protein